MNAIEFTKREDDLYQELLDDDDAVLYDVAKAHGQIVDNVKHMTWFKRAVLKEVASP
jgi:hypothetical protein